MAVQPLEVIAKLALWHLHPMRFLTITSQAIGSAVLSAETGLTEPTTLSQMPMGLPSPNHRPGQQSTQPLLQGGAQTWIRGSLSHIVLCFHIAPKRVTLQMSTPVLGELLALR